MALWILGGCSGGLIYRSLSNPLGRLQVFWEDRIGGGGGGEGLRVGDIRHRSRKRMNLYMMTLILWFIVLGVNYGGRFSDDNKGR